MTLEIFGLDDLVPPDDGTKSERQKNPNPSHRASQNKKANPSHQLVVTMIKPAVKDQNRVNVFVNNKFSFSLTLVELSDAHLKVGQILTKEELSELQSVSDFGKLYQRTLEYALTRPHSEKEIRDYLRRKQAKRAVEQKRYDEFKKRLTEDAEYRERIKQLRLSTREKNAELRNKSFEEDNRYEYTGRAKTQLPTKPGPAILNKDIERVIDKLKATGAIDDAEFARYFVANRNRHKGTSFKKLKLELRNKGIADNLIEAAFSTDDYGEAPRDETEEIRKIIAKKRAKYAFRELTADEKKVADQKLTQYLLRQGFPYDLVRDLLHEMD